MAARRKAKSAPLTDRQKFVTGAVLDNYHEQVVAPLLAGLVMEVEELKARVSATFTEQVMAMEGPAPEAPEEDAMAPVRDLLATSPFGKGKRTTEGA